MGNWLETIMQLVGQTDRQILAKKYCQILVQQFGLSHADLLQLTVDGRFLCSAVMGIEQNQWPVDDFTMPFAHVIQQGQAMTFSYNERLFWQNNSQLVALFRQIGRHEDLCMIPLYTANRSKLLLLLVVADRQMIKTLQQQKEFLLINQLLLKQWALLAELQVRAKRTRQLSDSIEHIQQQHLSKQLKSKLVGSSRPIAALRETIITAAQSRLAVLIEGETGTGKELVAQALHANSRRHNQPFITINCAAIPENLLESELFGYEKGAFSGAEQKKVGLIQAANGGTLFLDEIGDMPLALQAKLLRVLETQCFRPLGSQKEVRSDFRLLAATHVDLRQKIKQGLFRQDLYYRLRQYPIKVPALREHREDLPELIDHFIALFNQSNRCHINALDNTILTQLNTYDFPGNVRELKNIIELACVKNAAHIDLTQPDTDGQLDTPMLNSGDGWPSFNDIHDLRSALLEFESRVIASRLNYFKGDREKTAESLGLPKRTLAYRCTKLEIE